MREADQGVKSNGAMAGARLAIRFLINDVSVCDAADWQVMSWVTGLPIGASRRRTAASEISSPPADVEQRQVYLETGHRRHELRGARMFRFVGHLPDARANASICLRLRAGVA